MQNSDEVTRLVYAVEALEKTTAELKELIKTLPDIKSDVTRLSDRVQVAEENIKFLKSVLFKAAGIVGGAFLLALVGLVFKSGLA